jgi:hypothetical protein
MADDGSIKDHGPIRRFAERFKPAARARTHLLAAAGLWTVVGLGLSALGFVWCFAVRRRLAEKNAARVIRRGDGHCLGGFLSGKTWLLVAVMMTAGIVLRRSGVPHAILGVLYSAIGTALLAGSVPLWKARRRPADI